MIQVFSMTFPGLEMTILKFHDFSSFSMTVRTLWYADTLIPRAANTQIRLNAKKHTHGQQRVVG